MRTLILNADMTPFDIVPWQKAIVKLLCDQTVILLEEYKYVIRDGKGNAYRVPAVVSLKNYIKHQNKHAPYSRMNVYARDMSKCQYCNRIVHGSDRTIDHVIPRSIYSPSKHKVKLNGFENIVTCCKSCNSKKADRTPEQAGMKLLKVPRTISRAQAYYNKLCLITNIPPQWRTYIGSQQQEEV
jgi:5-methylcytosine-specific restriction endonuclease McrA